MPLVYLPGENRTISVPAGTNLMDALRDAGIYLDAPCGGNGKCGKCRVLADGREVLACRTAAHRDMTVTIPETSGLNVLHRGIAAVQKMDPL